MYYTPDSEEFCIGLDIQVKYEDGWKDRKIRHGEDLCEIVSRYTTDKESVRVKCFDREDILEFGFILTGKPTENKSYYREEYENFGITAIDNFYDVGESNIHIYEFFRYSTKTIFSGKIKNKKEFKKLLAQLNI